MSLPYNRVFNFSAGPSTLPVGVLEQAREEILNWRGAGMGVMEMSHRSPEFESILKAAKDDLTQLLQIPDGYSILFLQGGASLQFSMAPMNFLTSSAAYVITGAWGRKAVEAAQLEGTVQIAWSGKEFGYKTAPDWSLITPDPASSYLHFTSNETIEGVQFHTDPTFSVPVFADMSSDILSRKVDISRYSMIYAGAQKNMGPAGATLVLIKNSILGTANSSLAPMLDYAVQVKNDSMYNTPSCWSIYICGLVYRHLLHHGGIEAIEKTNARKAGSLYDAIDSSDGFFKGHADKDSRSTMNVTFTLQDDSKTDDFVAFAEEKGLVGIKGHRSVGGCRASIYNAMPEAGATLLAECMDEFRKK